MVSETQQKINSIANTMNMAMSHLDNGHSDSSVVWIGVAQTEALLLIARQLGELIDLVGAIALDLTTEGD